MYVDVAGGQLDWRAAYKLCIGFINPRPIALVSTVSSDGQPNLAPFSFYNMVSANPPVVIVVPSLRRDQTKKHTLLNIEATREFVVATVTESIARAMVACAADLPHGQSEFEFSGLTPVPATRVRPPRVLESPVNIECALERVVRMGEGPGAGQVVFGRVVALHVRDDIVTPDGAIDPHKLRTVGRLGGAWYCTVTQPYQMQIPPPPT